MPRRKTRSKTVVAAVLLLLPPVAYAAWLLALFLLDSLRGDGLVLHQYYFESRGRLLLQLVSDGLRALPVFYAATALLWVMLRLLSRFRPRSGILAAIIVGVFTGLISAALLLGVSWGAMVPTATAGSLLALILHAAMRPSPVPR